MPPNYGQSPTSCGRPEADCQQTVSTGYAHQIERIPCHAVTPARIFTGCWARRTSTSLRHSHDTTSGGPERGRHRMLSKERSRRAMSIPCHVQAHDMWRPMTCGSPCHVPCDMWRGMPRRGGCGAPSCNHPVTIPSRAVPLNGVIPRTIAIRHHTPSQETRRNHSKATRYHV